MTGQGQSGQSCSAQKRRSKASRGAGCASLLRQARPERTRFHSLESQSTIQAGGGEASCCSSESVTVWGQPETARRMEGPFSNRFRSVSKEQEVRRSNSLSAGVRRRSWQTRRYSVISVSSETSLWAAGRRVERPAARRSSPQLAKWASITCELRPIIWRKWRKVMSPRSATSRWSSAIRSWRENWRTFDQAMHHFQQLQRSLTLPDEVARRWPTRGICVAMDRRFGPRRIADWRIFSRAVRSMKRSIDWRSVLCQSSGVSGSSCRYDENVSSCTSPGVVESLELVTMALHDGWTLLRIRARRRSALAASRPVAPSDFLLPLPTAAPRRKHHTRLP
jgi:hypothetical protein